MKNFKLIDLTVHGDEQGKLVALEKVLIVHLKLSEHFIFMQSINL